MQLVWHTLVAFATLELKNDEAGTKVLNLVRFL